MRVVAMDKASNLFRAMAQFKFGAAEMANEQSAVASYQLG